MGALILDQGAQCFFKAQFQLPPLANRAHFLFLEYVSQDGNAQQWRSASQTLEMGWG